MSRTNPYDDFDAFDPYEDEDASGAFDFVEDEYDSMEQGVGDGFTYVDSPLDTPVVRSGSTEAFPATQVRTNFGEPVAPQGPPPSVGPTLHRRKKKRGRAAQVPMQPQPQPVAPAPGRPHVRRRKRHHFGCLFTLLVFAALLVGAYWVVAHPIDDQLAFSPAEQQTVNGTLSWSIPGMPYYVLTLGSDAREWDETSRTDSMMLMRVDLIGGKLTMVSIPRDTMVQIDGYGTSKINAAYAYGGAGGAVRAVSELTHVPINHVAVIHFEELVGLIDYLGGVTVNVPVDVYDPEYSGLVLSAGTQTMDGETALAWARARHGYEDGDIQRQASQRILLTAIMNRILSLSPSEMPNALKQMGGLVGTDMRCYNLVPLLVRFKLANPTVYSCALPTTSEYVDGLWYEILDESAASKLMQVVNSGGDPSTVG